MKKLKKISVLYNLPEGNTADDLDTQKSANNVFSGLQRASYQTELVGIRVNEVKIVAQLQADLVFNLIEWTGRNYRYGIGVIETLESAGLAYTGSNAWGYQVCADKVLMKRLFDKYDICTPVWQTLKSGTEKLGPLPYPVIVKPAYEHCAIGISQTSVCQNETEVRQKASELIRQYKQPMLVEEYIDGDEAQVTVLEKNGRPWVLPPAVFRYQKKDGFWPINTYDAKWSEGWEAEMSDWVLDKKLPTKIVRQIYNLARQCYLKLGGRSYPRMDMRINGDKVYVLEINNNPGIDFDSGSGIAVSAKMAGLDWEGLLTNIVEEAYDSTVV